MSRFDPLSVESTVSVVRRLLDSDRENSFERRVEPCLKEEMWWIRRRLLVAAKKT